MSSCFILQNNKTCLCTVSIGKRFPSTGYCCIYSSFKLDHFQLSGMFRGQYHAREDAAATTEMAVLAANDVRSETG